MKEERCKYCDRPPLRGGVCSSCLKRGPEQWMKVFDTQYSISSHCRLRNDATGLYKAPSSTKGGFSYSLYKVNKQSKQTELWWVNARSLLLMFFPESKLVVTDEVFSELRRVSEERNCTLRIEQAFKRLGMKVCPVCRKEKTGDKFITVQGKISRTCSSCRDKAGTVKKSQAQYIPSSGNYTTKRKCHGVPQYGRLCSKMITNFRCDDCWAFLRKKEKINVAGNSEDEL